MTTDHLVHGLRVRTETDDDGVARAVARRLRPYWTPVDGAADLLLVYGGPVPTPADDPRRRTIYETGGGRVVYHPAEDLLTADVGGVRLHAALGAGVARFDGGTWSGSRRHAAVHTLTTLVLMERFERLGRHALHAGCLARGGRGVLLAGASGAGKSTLALALALRGLELLGDDLVFLRDDRVLGLADAVGLTADTRARFPALAGEVIPDDGFPKALARPEELPGCRTTDSCAPALLVFPRIVPGGASRLDPLSPAEAFTRLVPDVLLTRPGSSQHHLAAIARLTGGVSCWELAGGSDVAASAALIDRLLATSRTPERETPPCIA